MSTDGQFPVDRRPAVGAFLEHPLVGRRYRRTVVALVYLAALVGLFAVSYAGSTVTIGGDPLEALVPGFDSVSAALIAMATATITVVPFLYAAWNGGPAMAAALPLVPVFLGDIAAGQYVLDLDAAIALTIAGAAGPLALAATDVRETGSFRPWNATASGRAPLFFVTGVTAVAAVGVGRFVLDAPPRSLEWYRPFVVLWVVPLAVAGSYWQATFRTVVATRLEEERPRS